MVNHKKISAQKTLKMRKSCIFTQKELKVIDKKLKGGKLSQVDSNYLARFIRPKLKEIALIDATLMLSKIKYNQKIKSIERKIISAALKKIKSIQAIIIYGSTVQTNYSEYNDIDIMIITKNKILMNLGEKARKILELKKELSKSEINADIEIYNKKTILNASLHSPSLIYQLKDHKVIYGKLKLPNKKKEVYNIDLKMKLDWSDIDDIEPKGIDIYKALRNIILVRLLLNKIVDNKKLKESLNEEIGKNLIDKMKNNQESKEERRIAINYLKKLAEITRKEIKGGLWEKIEL